MKDIILALTVLALLPFYIMLTGQLIVAESKLRNTSRSYEALKRTVGHSTSPAYVCYGGGAKKQLEGLLQ